MRIFLFLLNLTVFFVITYVLVTYLLALYELRRERIRYNLKRAEGSPPKSGIPFFRLLRAVLLETLATLAAVFLSVLFWLKLDKGEAQNGRPILLVHGYIHNQTAWLWLRKQLENAGLGPIYSLY